MSVPPQDTSKKGTVTRSQAKKNPTLAEEIKETSQSMLKPRLKAREDTDKFLQYSEMSSALDQTDLLDISAGSISDPDIRTKKNQLLKQKTQRVHFSIN